MSFEDEEPVSAEIKPEIEISAQLEETTSIEKTKVEYKGLPVDKTTDLFLGVLDEGGMSLEDEEPVSVETQPASEVSPQPKEPTTVEKTKVAYKGLPVDETTDLFIDILDEEGMSFEDESPKGEESKSNEATNTVPLVTESVEQEKKVEYKGLPVDQSTNLFMDVLDQDITWEDSEDEFEIQTRDKTTKYEEITKSVIHDTTEQTQIDTITNVGKEVTSEGDIVKSDVEEMQQYSTMNIGISEPQQPKLFYESPKYDILRLLEAENKFYEQKYATARQEKEEAVSSNEPSELESKIKVEEPSIKYDIIYLLRAEAEWYERMNLQDRQQQQQSSVPTASETDRPTENIAPSIEAQHVPTKTHTDMDSTFITEEVKQLELQTAKEVDAEPQKEAIVEDTTPDIAPTLRPHAEDTASNTVPSEEVSTSTNEFSEVMSSVVEQTIDIESEQSEKMVPSIEAQHAPTKSHADMVSTFITEEIKQLELQTAEVVDTAPDVAPTFIPETRDTDNETVPSEEASTSAEEFSKVTSSVVEETIDTESKQSMLKDEEVMKFSEQTKDTETVAKKVHSQFEAILEKATEFIPKSAIKSELSTDATEFVPKGMEYSRLNPNAAEFIPGSLEKKATPEYVDYAHAYKSPKVLPDTPAWEYSKDACNIPVAQEHYDPCFEIPPDHASNEWVNQMLHEPSEEFLIHQPSEKAAHAIADLEQKQIEESLLPREVVSELKTSGITDTHTTISWTGQGEPSHWKIESEQLKPPKSPRRRKSKSPKPQQKAQEQESEPFFYVEPTTESTNVWEALQRGDKTYADVVATGSPERTPDIERTSPVESLKIKPEDVVSTDKSADELQVESPKKNKRKSRKRSKSPRLTSDEVHEATETNEDEIKQDVGIVPEIRQQTVHDVTVTEIEQVTPEPVVQGGQMTWAKIAATPSREASPKPRQKLDKEPSPRPKVQSTTVVPKTTTTAERAGKKTRQKDKDLSKDVKEPLAVSDRVTMSGDATPSDVTEFGKSEEQIQGSPVESNKETAEPPKKQKKRKERKVKEAIEEQSKKESVLVSEITTDENVLTESVDTSEQLSSYAGILGSKPKQDLTPEPKQGNEQIFPEETPGSVKEIVSGFLQAEIKNQSIEPPVVVTKVDEKVDITKAQKPKDVSADSTLCVEEISVSEPAFDKNVSSSYAGIVGKKSKHESPIPTHMTETPSKVSKMDVLPDKGSKKQKPKNLSPPPEICKQKIPENKELVEQKPITQPAAEDQHVEHVSRRPNAQPIIINTSEAEPPVQHIAIQDIDLSRLTYADVTRTGRSRSSSPHPSTITTIADKINLRKDRLSSESPNRVQVDRFKDSVKQPVEDTFARDRTKVEGLPSKSTILSPTEQHTIKETTTTSSEPEAESLEKTEKRYRKKSRKSRKPRDSNLPDTGEHPAREKEPHSSKATNIQELVDNVELAATPDLPSSTQVVEKSKELKPSEETLSSPRDDSPTKSWASVVKVSSTKPDELNEIEETKNVTTGSEVETSDAAEKKRKKRNKKSKRVLSKESSHPGNDTEDEHVASDIGQKQTTPDLSSVTVDQTIEEIKEQIPPEDIAVKRDESPTKTWASVVKVSSTKSDDEITEEKAPSQLESTKIEVSSTTKEVTTGSEAEADYNVERKRRKKNKKAKRILPDASGLLQPDDKEEFNVRNAAGKPLADSKEFLIYEKAAAIATTQEQEERVSSMEAEEQQAKSSQKSELTAHEEVKLIEAETVVEQVSSPPKVEDAELFALEKDEIQQIPETTNVLQTTNQYGQDIVETVNTVAIEELTPPLKVYETNENDDVHRVSEIIVEEQTIKQHDQDTVEAEKQLNFGSQVAAEETVNADENASEIEKLKQTLVEIRQQERMMDLIIENAAKQETATNEEFLTHLKQHEDRIAEETVDVMDSVIIPQISVVITPNVEEIERPWEFEASGPVVKEIDTSRQKTTETVKLEEEKKLDIAESKEKSPLEALVENISMDDSIWLTKSIYEECESNWQINLAEQRIQEISKESSSTDDVIEEHIYMATTDIGQLAHNLTLDSFWLTKSIYDKAEEQWQEEMVQKSKGQAGGDSKKPSDRSPEDDGDDSDSSSGSRSPSNKPDGEGTLKAPGSEYMMYTLPGGIAGWKETSTYLSPEPLNVTLTDIPLTESIDATPSSSISLGPEQQSTSLAVGGEARDGDQQAKKKGKWFKKDLTDEVERLQVSLISTESTIEYLPKESFEDMINALEHITSELKKHAAEAIRLEGQVNKLTSDHETQSLVVLLAGIRTRIATLLSQAENGRILVTNARERQRKEQEELSQYQSFLVEIEHWLESTKTTLATFVKPSEEREIQSSLENFERLSKEIENKEDRLKKLAIDCETFKNYPDLQALVVTLLEQLRVLSEAFEEQKVILNTQIVQLKEYLVIVKEGEEKVEDASLENTLDSTSMPIEEIPVHVEAKAPVEGYTVTQGVTIETQTGRSLSSPVEEPPTKDFTVVYNQPVDAQTQAQMSLPSSEAEHTQQKETITISKRTSGGQETIQIATKPQQESQPIVEEPDDVLVEANYRKRPESETRVTELNISNVVPNQPFETVFVEPDETTTEVIVDADGTKRIIVKKLHRTVVRHQQSSQQQQLTTLSSIADDGVPVTQSFSQITLKGQQSSTTVAKGDGSKATVTSQQYGGKVATGVPGGDVNVHEYQTDPEVQYTVVGPTIKPEEVEVQGVKLHEGDITLVDNQNHLMPVAEGAEVHTSSSSVRAVVQQVTRRIIRKTRRIIRRTVIIDGKEHVTEEVVEEPEEIEVTEEGIPRVSINVTRTEDGKVVQEQQFGEQATFTPGTTTIQKVKTVVLDSSGKPVENVEQEQFGQEATLTAEVTPPVLASSGKPLEASLPEQESERYVLDQKLTAPQPDSAPQVTQSFEVEETKTTDVTKSFIDTEKLDSSDVGQTRSTDAAPTPKSRKKKKGKKTPEDGSQSTKNDFVAPADVPHPTEATSQPESLDSTTYTIEEHVKTVSPDKTIVTETVDTTIAPIADAKVTEEVLVRIPVKSAIVAEERVSPDRPQSASVKLITQDFIFSEKSLSPKTVLEQSVLETLPTKQSLENKFNQFELEPVGHTSATPEVSKVVLEKTEVTLPAVDKFTQPVQQTQPDIVKIPLEKSETIAVSAEDVASKFTQSTLEPVQQAQSGIAKTPLEKSEAVSTTSESLVTHEKASAIPEDFVTNLVHTELEQIQAELPKIHLERGDALQPSPDALTAKFTQPELEPVQDQPAVAKVLLEKGDAVLSSPESLISKFTQPELETVQQLVKIPLDKAETVTSSAGALVTKFSQPDTKKTTGAPTELVKVQETEQVTSLTTEPTGNVEMFLSLEETRPEFTIQTTETKSTKHDTISAFLDNERSRSEQSVVGETVKAEDKSVIPTEVKSSQTVDIVLSLEEKQQDSSMATPKVSVAMKIEEDTETAEVIHKDIHVQLPKASEKIETIIPKLEGEYEAPVTPSDIDHGGRGSKKKKKHKTPTPIQTPEDKKIDENQGTITPSVAESSEVSLPDISKESEDTPKPTFGEMDFPSGSEDEEEEETGKDTGYEVDKTYDEAADDDDHDKKKRRKKKRRQKVKVKESEESNLPESSTVGGDSVPLTDDEPILVPKVEEHKKTKKRRKGKKRPSESESETAVLAAHEEEIGSPFESYHTMSSVSETGTVKVVEEHVIKTPDSETAEIPSRIVTTVPVLETVAVQETVSQTSPIEQFLEQERSISEKPVLAPVSVQTSPELPTAVEVHTEQVSVQTTPEIPKETAELSVQTLEVQKPVESPKPEVQESSTQFEISQTDIITQTTPKAVSPEQKPVTETIETSMQTTSPVKVQLSEEGVQTVTPEAVEISRSETAMQATIESQEEAVQTKSPETIATAEIASQIHPEIAESALQTSPEQSIESHEESVQTASPETVPKADTASQIHPEIKEFALQTSPEPSAPPAEAVFPPAVAKETAEIVTQTSPVIIKELGNLITPSPTPTPSLSDSYEVHVKASVIVPPSDTSESVGFSTQIVETPSTTSSTTIAGEESSTSESSDEDYHVEVAVEGKHVDVEGFLDAERSGEEPHKHKRKRHRKHKKGHGKEDRPSVEKDLFAEFQRQNTVDESGGNKELYADIARRSRSPSPAVQVSQGPQVMPKSEVFKEAPEIHTVEEVLQENLLKQAKALEAEVVSKVLTDVDKDKVKKISDKKQKSKSKKQEPAATTTTTVDISMKIPDEPQFEIVTKDVLTVTGDDKVPTTSFKVDSMLTEAEYKTIPETKVEAELLRSTEERAPKSKISSTVEFLDAEKQPETVLINDTPVTLTIDIDAQKPKQTSVKPKTKGKHVSSVTIEEVQASSVVTDTPLTPASDFGQLSPPDYSTSSWKQPVEPPQAIAESEYQQGPLLLKEVNVRWNQAQALERFKNLQNARTTTHLSDVLYLATRNEIVTDETAQQRIDNVEQNLNLVQQAVEMKDVPVLQQTIITTVDTITTWLETIEYRIYVNRQQTSDGPSRERVEEFNDLKQEIAAIEGKVEQLQNVMQQTSDIYNEDDRERMKSYINSLQQQVKVIEEVTDENEKLAAGDLQRWDEFTNGVANITYLLEQLKRQLSDLKESDASPQTKLSELDKLENGNRCHMVKVANLISTAKGLMRDFPSREIPREVYLNNEMTKQLEQQISIERDKALQLLSLADEYEQTLKEFSQIIIIAEALVESPISVRNLEHLEDEMQNHRKFFVNLSHCRAILESLEENLDSETRAIHSKLHQNLYERASVILDKSTGRFQQMSLAASRWTVLEQGTKEEMRWLQVAQQRVPDLNNVTSADYDRYIDLYQSLEADIDYHHAKLLHLNSVARRLQELVQCADLEQAYAESLEIIQKLQEDVQSKLDRLISFRDSWTIYNMQSDKVEYWLREADMELRKLEVPSVPRGHLRQFWELKAQHEVYNVSKNQADNALERALQIVPLSDEMVQRKFHNELNGSWQEVSTRISDIEASILETIQAPDLPVNEKLALLEQELQDLKVDLDNMKGIIKTEDELNLYVERLQIMSTRLDTIQNELGRLGLLSAGESDKVGSLLALSKRLESTITEELENGNLVKERLLAIQKGMERVRRKHLEMSKGLDQCEDAEKLGSEAVEKSVNECFEIGEELVTLWQDLMALRQMLHTLPMRLKVTVSPVQVERDISQLQDDHTALEKRCGQILALLRSRLGLWQRFERQLELVQQSVQEADFMVELLTVQGTVDYERLRKATERLESVSGDLANRESLIQELKTSAQPLAESCSPEVSAKVEAAVKEAVTAYENTKENLTQLCGRYKKAAELWKRYREAADVMKEWVEEVGQVGDMEPEEALEKVKVCEETLAAHTKRLAELQELVSGIAEAVGVDANSLLGGEVTALGRKLEEAKDAIGALSDAAEENIRQKEGAKKDALERKEWLEGVRKEIVDMSKETTPTENEGKLVVLRDHLLALSKAEGQIQQIKDKTVEISTTTTETSVIEVLELWQQVIRETFQQYHRLSTTLVKNEDGAAALRLWEEYLLYVQQFLQGTIPGDCHSLSEHQSLCQVHQNLLTTQQNVLQPSSGGQTIEPSIMQQFSSLSNLHNEILSRIMDRHSEVQNRLNAWEKYKKDQNRLLAWLKGVEKERDHMQLRYMHIRRIPKLLTRIQTLLDKIPQGEEQADTLQRQQNILLQFCDDALATSIRMEHVAIKQRISNIRAGLDTWKQFLERIEILVKTHEEKVEKVQKLFVETQEIINESVSHSPASHASCTNRLEQLQRTRARLNTYTQQLEELVLSQEQLKECLSPSDMKTINQRMLILRYQQGDLDHQIASICHQLEDKLGVKSMFETRQARFIAWINDLENKLDEISEETAVPSDPKELLRKLETELQAEMALKEREYNWLLKTGKELVDSCGDEYAEVTSKQIIQHRTDEVLVRWERLENLAKSRFNKINDMMQTIWQLEERIAQIRAWLTQIELQLAKPLIFEAATKEVIDRKIQDHDKLKKSIERESGNIGEVLNLCELLLSDPDVLKAHFSTDNVTHAVQNLEKRWKVVCGQSAERKRKISFIWKLLQEVLKLSTDHEQWINDREQQLKNLDKPVKKLGKAEIQQLIYSVENEIKDIESRVPTFQILEQTYSKLATASGIDPENIQELTSRARVTIARWENLMPKAQSLLQKLQNELIPFKEFSLAHEDAVVGLTKLDAQVTELQHLSPPEKVPLEERLKKLEAIEKRLNDQTPTLETADKLGLQIMKKSKKQEVTKIQEMIDEYQILCKNIHERIVEIKTEIMTQVKRQPREVDESVQVETLKFEQDTAVQVNTLPPQLQRMTSISAKDAYLVELEAALGECKANLDELEMLVNKEIPKQGSSELPGSSKKIAKISANCQASVELIKHIHDLLINECNASETEACSEMVRMLVERFQVLLVKAKEKEQKLRELSEAGRLLCPLCTKRNWAQLDNDLWRLEKWLQFAEGTQKSQRSPPSNIEQLEDVIQDHREFLLDLDSHKSIVRSLNIVGTHLADHSEDTSKATDLRERLEKDNKRWEVICQHAAEWQVQLQKALMNNQQFHAIISELCVWLEKNERKIKASEPVDLTAPTETIETKYNNFVGLRAELERCEPRVLSLQEAANQLFRDEDAPEGSSSIHRRLTDLRLKLQSLIRLTGIYTLKLGAVLGRDPNEIGIAVASSSGSGAEHLSPLSYDLLDHATQDGTTAEAPGDDAYNGGTDGQINTSVLRRSCRFLGRVVRASMPIQALMLLMLGAASLVPYSEDDYSCSLVNSIANSMMPTLRYNDGPPPI
ncbi:unnamed protein product [Acanthoscelides obtectus]|uniref:KASH domain-containing protein n=1 Tax=Acanthoscelides obtectus TaxID=200917 RepID=A0A9P0L3M2_ACAOB|nr:unnamed protein product [Acanthoscelides obtectus]CAK1626728.1 Nesprin-1 [Acanthoscelides obtectus]